MLIFQSAIRIQRRIIFETHARKFPFFSSFFLDILSLLIYILFNRLTFFSLFLSFSAFFLSLHLFWYSPFSLFYGYFFLVNINFIQFLAPSSSSPQLSLSLSAFFLYFFCNNLFSLSLYIHFVLVNANIIEFVAPSSSPPSIFYLFWPLFSLSFMDIMSLLTLILFNSFALSREWKRLLIDACMHILKLWWYMTRTKDRLLPALKVMKKTIFCLSSCLAVLRYYVYIYIQYTYTTEGRAQKKNKITS